MTVNQRVAGSSPAAGADNQLLIKVAYGGLLFFANNLQTGPGELKWKTHANCPPLATVK